MSICSSGKITSSGEVKTYGRKLRNSATEAPEMAPIGTLFFVVRTLTSMVLRPLPRKALPPCVARYASSACAKKRLEELRL